MAESSVKASPRKPVVYFMILVILTIFLYALALLIMYWTNSLVFAPFVRELPNDAFWVVAPGSKVRTDEEVADRIEFVNDYLDRS